MAFKKILWQKSPAAGAAEKKCGRTLYKRYFSAASEAEEQERAEKALQSCLKRNPKKYDPATQEGRAAIGRFLYARGFASKYIQKSINNIHGSVILMDDC